MVTARTTAYDVAARVVDPELRVVTIAELGILRSVVTDGDRAVVTITPTYSGCPALEVIRTEVVAALRDAGWREVEVATQLEPAWTTDWLSESGRAKLAEAGIAPPGAAPPGGPVPLGLPHRPPANVGDFGGMGPPEPPDIGQAGVACPRCGSAETAELSRFGSTACKALWRCARCREPFEHMKAI